jgi:hypothetical protein
LAEVARGVGEEVGGAAQGAAVGAAGGACPECEAELAGDFCHRCGEKRPESRDLSVRRFFDEAAQELTSVEHSKLFHTLWALLFRPGFLTNEWVAGRRRRYLKPLNLCLGVFALSLFAYSVYKPVSMYDAENIIRHDQYGSAKKVFGKMAERKGVTLEAFMERVSDRWQRYVSLSTLLFVAGFAAVLQIVFMFSPRYFVEHLVFAMHFVSFSVLTVVLMWPVYFFIGLKPGGVNTWVAVLKWSLDIAYMFFAVRAVYRLGAGLTLVAAVLLTAGYFLTYVTVFVAAFAAALVASYLL